MLHLGQCCCLRSIKLHIALIIGPYLYNIRANADREGVCMYDDKQGIPTKYKQSCNKITEYIFLNRDLCMNLPKRVYIVDIYPWYARFFRIY